MSMPIYEYQCERGHKTERLQSVSEPPLKICEVCGGECERVLSPPQIKFLGSGFHNTDYKVKLSHGRG